MSHGTTIHSVGLGYADLDESSKFEDVDGWLFWVVPEYNENHEVLVVESPQTENALNAVTSEGDEFTSKIGAYLSAGDALGRSGEIISGTIRCALELDRDGLPDCLELEILDQIPDSIGAHHDGRMFVIVKTFILIDSMGAQDPHHLNLDNISPVQIGFAISY